MRSVVRFLLTPFGLLGVLVYSIQAAYESGRFTAHMWFGENEEE